MTPQELELLLTVARILRAHLRDGNRTNWSDMARDAADVDEALRPWESTMRALHPNEKSGD